MPHFVHLFIWIFGLLPPLGYYIFNLRVLENIKFLNLFLILPLKMKEEYFNTL